MDEYFTCTNEALMECGVSMDDVNDMFSAKNPLMMGDMGGMDDMDDMGDMDDMDDMELAPGPYNEQVKSWFKQYCQQGEYAV